MPRRRARGQVAAGVVRRADRGGQLYLRFRAVVYENQLAGGLRPARRQIASQCDVYRRATDPWDWKAGVEDASDDHFLLGAYVVQEPSL